MGQEVILSGDQLSLVPPGLFLINRLDTDDVDHAVVFDSGNVLEIKIEEIGNKSVIYHLPKNKTLHSPTLEEYLKKRREQGDCNPQFSFQGKCVDQVGIQAAKSRLIKIHQRKEEYNWLFNNCEHFAYEVMTGKKKSPQLRSGMAVAGLLAIVSASSLLSSGNRRA
ncbi:hypothetical protein [Crocosphaera sp.]|uniref:hypothetical protein n=1 Tax=Crocosphaera sp. TaxID=2729996 RepID=UPI0026335A70|nr:hypothetical protein [Crocosphaera sp.]MDJ0578544.1 hypothetical protein [Crocosphaera sp.]